MTSRYPSWCDYCLHDQNDGTCAAFPGGIPDAITTGAASHSTPVPGDGGITFTLDPAKREQFEDERAYLPAE